MLLKEQASSIISTYTADISGMCSALFEFGGMCVMHDASGCNSTYNTHDEPRWYDTDSMVYISALTEIEAIMGDDNKIINDVTQAARELQPKFVALCASPISSIIGTDMDAVAGAVYENTKIPSFAVHCSGMNSYLHGAGYAFLRLLQTFAEENVQKRDMSVNILGTTPLDFSVCGYAEDMSGVLEKGGFHIIARLGMGGDINGVKNAGAASVNLVVSSCGLPAARWLYEKFGTPYVVGVPIYEHEDKILGTLKLAAKSGKCRDVLPNQPDKTSIFIIGEAVTAGAAAACAKEKYGISMGVICPPDTDGELLKKGYHMMTGENVVRELLKSAETVIADPLYRPICPKGAAFVDFPHEAFSGRIYRDKIENLLRKF